MSSGKMGARGWSRGGGQSKQKLETQEWTARPGLPGRRGGVGQDA